MIIIFHILAVIQSVFMALLEAYDFSALKNMAEYLHSKYLNQ